MRVCVRESIKFLWLKQSLNPPATFSLHLVAQKRFLCVYYDFGLIDGISTLQRTVPYARIKREAFAMHLAFPALGLG